MVSYSLAVGIFFTGLITAIITSVYIVGGYYKFKDKDPFEGE